MKIQEYHQYKGKLNSNLAIFFNLAKSELEDVFFSLISMVVPDFLYLYSFTQIRFA